jgi:NACalpha-BTF3-like transcription factor
MSIVELLADPSIRKTLNADRNFERLRYLVVLAAASEPPFQTSGTAIEGKPTFNVKQLWRVATRLGLDFERFRGAERVFRYLEKSSLVKNVRTAATGYHTQYYATESGINETVINLDRLRKIQEFESQAKTMQMTIKKQLAAQPSPVLEIPLSHKTLTIGRDKQSDLTVDDPYMSSKHARIAYDSGKWILEDLNSKNGSWKIEPDILRRITRVEIVDSELYQIGSTVFRFRCARSVT